MHGVASSHSSLSPEDFREWIVRRRAAGESMAAIGWSLGVSQPAVSQWLSGSSGISDTVLMLAWHLRQAPIDLADGLPVGDRSAGG